MRLLLIGLLSALGGLCTGIGVLFHLSPELGARFAAGIGEHGIALLVSLMNFSVKWQWWVVIGLTIWASTLLIATRSK